uniref:Zinc finger GRF-type domain-containing protein n=1 Tax=Brassica oleracea var. oleracea TaxID=109376 RepID=A0A0D3AK07_BRAOL
MAGGQSNTSGDSRGSSSGRRPSRGAGRFFGVPKKCWCGELMVTLTSKSDQNPYRRYLRCSFAAENKWVDEALLNEVDTLLLKNARLEEVINEMASKSVFERTETEIMATVEDALAEASAKMKNTMIVVVIGSLTLVGMMGVMCLMRN